MAHQELSPEQDFHAWALNAAQRARAGLLTPQELEQVAEELEDMAKSERRQLKNRLSILLAHLLKWRHQPERRSRSWRATIEVQRGDVQDLLEDNPSLCPCLPEFIEQAYQRGVWLAIQETDLDKAVFPATFEQTGWSYEQVLDMDSFPE
jgi:hypothetical protein